MDQSKEHKAGIFHTLKQRFWPNAVTTRSCFKKRGTKIKLKSGSNHCNLNAHESDTFPQSFDNSCETTKLKNILSLSEPAIALQANLNENIENVSPPLSTVESDSNVEASVVNPTLNNTNNADTMCCQSFCTTGSTNSFDGRELSSIALSHYAGLGRTQKEANVHHADSDSSRSGLMCELVKLSKYGWYWGGMSKEEAEEKLTDQPDGAFLLRDSSADHFILSLSFRSFGKTLHTRIEYSHVRGQFSFYQQADESFATIAELIDHCMSYSQSAIYCYSRSRSPGIPAFPVRLTKPVSRFAQIRSLQHLCRFVIRETIRLDNIQKLPLPKSIKGYLEEGHY